MSHKQLFSQHKMLAVFSANNGRYQSVYFPALYTVLVLRFSLTCTNVDATVDKNGSLVTFTSPSLRICGFSLRHCVS